MSALEQRTLMSMAPPAIGLNHDRLRQLALVSNTANPTQATGLLKRAEALSSTAIRVQFKTPISRQLAPKLRFEISGLEVTKSQVARDGRSATLTTKPQEGTTYTARVSLVRGPGGKERVTRQGTASFSGQSAPKVISVTPIGETSILVTYDRAMGAQALVPSNYSVVGITGQPVEVTSAHYEGASASVVSLQTTPQSYGSYSFNINNVTDTRGQQVFFEGRKIVGNPKGAVISVAATSSTRIVVAFNEPMADNALAPQHYSIKDPSGKALLVTDARFDGPLGMVVVLTTAAQANVSYKLTAINITDLQNDDLSATANTGTFSGIAAPALTRAVPTDARSIILTFTGPVGDSALAPSTYRIAKLDVAGNVVGVLPVTGVTFVGGQRTVVELSTPTQEDARYRVTTTSALTDVAGTPLPSVQLEVRGISGQPKLVGANPAGPNTILLTFSQPMSDDALSPTSYVIKDASGATLTVLGAQFVGTERRVVQLITGPQAAGVYTIVSIGATDLDGNPVPAPGAAGGFQGAPAPSLSNATPTDPTHVVLTFGGPVGDSALAPSSYKIEKLDAAGNVVGTLAVNAAAFVGGQRTVVSLTTPTQEAARYRITTTGTLTDAAGSALPVAQKEFQGVSGQPVLVGATSNGPTTMLLTFSVPMSDDALSPSSYVINTASGVPLPILNVRFVGTERRIVELTTATQTNQTYTIVSISATGGGGGTTIVPASPAVNTFPGLGTPGESTPVDGAPRVVGAASLSNTEVIVAFSEPMAASAVRPEHFFIVQQNVNPESGYLQITAADWYDTNHTVVKLTTLAQNELTYQVTAVVATDVAGNALAPPLLGVGGIVIDPRSSQFPGTPPSADSDGNLVDTDGDGLPDNVETRGWLVTVQLVDGTATKRTVTSNPALADSDGDGLGDYQEANIRTDPRNKDTDDDQINDFAEFNELYTNALAQDSDGDSLDDFLEFAFFKTSPVFADTDGDQLRDDYEIFSNRNPRVSDLPRPEIEIGEVNLQLDVRFTETNDDQRRDLETKSVNSTLTKSDKQSFTRSDTVNMEVHLEAGTKDGVDTKITDPNANTYVRGGFSVGYNFQQSSQSEAETQQAYAKSLSTDREVTRGFTVERAVQGAVMQVAVNLRNLSNLAYRIKNLQVTAFIQDPQDHARLTPVATLLPEPGSEPEEGFTLGALATERGPLIFTNTTVVPTLVESLMANSSGLIFRISNYDIIDESGRNFAFTSQEIVERTSRLVIDYGGASSLRALLGGEAFDELQPGDETEIFRVSTSPGQVIDTNFDGVIDGADRRATFDASGKEVGVTIFEALGAVGLTRYDEAVTPTASLTDEQILASFSTYIAPPEVIGGVSFLAREKIFRIRGLSNDSLNQKYWEILTPLGIDQVTDLDDLILKSSSPVSLNFVQDLDGDRLTADVEFFLRTSDSPLPVSATNPAPRGRDTDRDGLDDRFETLIGWTVTTPQRTYKVWSSPNRADSNFDDPTHEEDPSNLYDGSDAFAAPAGWTDLNGNNLRDRLNEVFQTSPSDYVLDPIRRDTDRDGIDDWEEVVGFTITRITDGSTIFRGLNPVSGLSPNPLNPDTDGDTFLDGNERTFGIDPTDPDDLDTDGDGLPDPVEQAGWNVTTTAVSTAGFQQGVASTNNRKSNTNSLDSDEDGLTDFEEYFLGSNALAADTDGDGIKDILELRGFTLGHKVGGDDLGIIKTLYLDADTDNDKRPDGAEAELVNIELNTWVVRVRGETPYRVYSNPLVADADFDGLVDGDEFNIDPLFPDRHTDPNNGNTDGDQRDDGVERGKTNPLAVDIRVTVVAESIKASSGGQFNFALTVKPPDSSGVAGLSTTAQTVIRSETGTSNRVGKVTHFQNGVYIAAIYYAWRLNDSSPWVGTSAESYMTRDSSQTYDPGLTKGIPAGATFVVYGDISAGPDGLQTNPLLHWIYDPGSTTTAKFETSDILTSADFDFRGLETPLPVLPDSPLATRSYSFGLANDERFAIEGYVTVFSPNGTSTTVNLGGLEGKRAFQESTTDTPTSTRPVFSYIQVADKFIEDYYFEVIVGGVTVKIKFFYLIG